MAVVILPVAVAAGVVARRYGQRTLGVGGLLVAAKQGVASAVNDVARELGAAFGIAIMGSVFNAGYRDDIEPALAALPPDAAEVAKDAPAAALALADQAGPIAAPLLAATRDAFMTGARGAMLAGAAMLLVGAAAVAWRAPRRNQDPEVHSELGTLDDHAARTGT